MIGIVFISAAAILLIAIIAANAKALSDGKKRTPEIHREKEQVEKTEQKENAEPRPRSNMDDNAYRKALSKFNDEEGSRDGEKKDMNDEGYRNALRNLHRKKN
ncbi:hypothetical protein GKZ89_13685 [Bacillus mangrovi]|uniref:Uncharacterized protein n=1 Tax=Metabacillus mangrovi TaxID=1491830 RepID=A0A7X2V5H0_9BACI|nr:hypothetical protein [Metabacillus mangrovi]MTH54450.1 hypothetical protein [Metabacillus mangrovi]